MKRRNERVNRVDFDLFLNRPNGI